MTEEEHTKRTEAIVTYRTWVKARDELRNNGVSVRRNLGHSSGSQEISARQFPGLYSAVKGMAVAHYDAKVHEARRRLVRLGIDPESIK